MGLYRRGEIYWFSIKVDGRKQVRLSAQTTNKKLADRIYTKTKDNILKGKHNFNKEESILFPVFADRYIEEHSKVNKKSWKSDVSKRKQLDVEFKDSYLQDIGTQQVNKFKSRLMKEEYAPATINKHLALLQGIFTLAIKWGVFDSKNPVKADDYLEENNTIERYLELAEIKSLLAACVGEVVFLVKIALTHGLRIGEAVGIRWSDIDLGRNLLYIRRSGPTAYSPKSGRNRVIPLSKVGKTIFQSMLKQKDTDNVFQHRHIKGFSAAVKKAKLHSEDRKLNVTFHTLRHTFASYHAIAGTDLYRIAKWIGDSLKTTEKRYAHLQPQYLKDSAHVLDAVMDEQNPITNLAQIQARHLSPNISSLQVLETK